MAVEHLRMPATPVLETPRLILRPIRESDWVALDRGFNDWEVVKYLDAKVPWPLPEGNAAARMADTAGEDVCGASAATGR